MSQNVLDYSTKIAQALLPNPILTASGCAANGRELSSFFPLSEIGAVVTKSIHSRIPHIGIPARPMPKRK